jgi:hypothetical protein
MFVMERREIMPDIQHSGTKDLPIGKNEDVQYDPTIADADDRVAQHRAEEADERAST